MNASRNRLLPWFVGIAIVVAAVVFVGWRMVVTGCAADTPVALGVLVLIPLVYLGLMFLTLTSQE
jgi:hypothetical protein